MKTETRPAEILINVASWFLQKKKNRYGQKFTQKALRKCSFYNSALRRRIVMNLHCEKGVKI